MSKYRDMFVQEALEHVNNLNNSLLSYEKSNSREDLDALFRSAHTIKGMAATMGYDNIRMLCKSMEDLFDDLRNDKISFSKGMADLLFNCFDLLQRLITDESFEIDLKPFLDEIDKFRSNASKEIKQEVKAKNKDTKITQELNELPSTIKVKLRDLDLLVDLVGELVITKMRLEQILKHHKEVENIVMSLDRLVSDLQYATMKLRLVPLDTIFSRFPRVVRDTASRLNKEVDFEMEGASIEIDRAILQAITDPLLHILRNAIDHGIEDPDERIRKGKDRVGKVRLVAEKSGERVKIIVEDDGKGIDVDAVKSKAVEKGLISKEEAEKMKDEDAFRLIALPGLSTAKQVSDVSGRGVGMDVVFKQVERVGGHVSIESKKDKGTKIIISIPLSISIISGLLVRIADDRYVIPLSSVITTVMVEKEDIKYVHGKSVIVLNGEIIELIDTARLLGLDSVKKDRLSIVVVDKGNKHVGLIVDSFEHRQEIVVKHLSNVIDANAFPDATIESDGSPVLILDPSIVL